MSKDQVRDLIEISHFAARHPEWVQGGGGNCSVKFNGEMLIKASGYVLEDVAESDGYVHLNLATNTPAAETALRPSMESPLHTFLSTFVIHTHPIEVGGLVCAQEGHQIFEDTFSDPRYVWIDYATPGQKLFEQVERTLKAKGHQREQDTVLFLQNHGLFVAAKNKEKCMQLHQETIQRCGQLFSPLNNGKTEMIENQFLTPDHVVYLSLKDKELSPKQRQAIQELKAFSIEVLRRIRAKGWQPHFLSDAEAGDVLGMPEEKYRQSLWDKSS